MTATRENAPRWQLRRQSAGTAWAAGLQRYGIVGVLVAVAVAAAIVSPTFGTIDNAANIVTAACFIGLITIGQSFVLITGGIDLSVGSMIGLGTVLAALAAPAGWVAALLVPIAAGIALGLVNGLLVGTARMAPFIITLSALLAVNGIAVALASSSIVIERGFFTSIANGSVLGLPNLVWILLIAFVVAAVVLNRTSFGSRMFALGGNEEAARMMGVNVTRVKIQVYTISGGLAGLAGALLASRLSSGVASLGSTYELKSIAAAVIGGVLLTGGVGTMLGALSGVLLIAMIDNLINQMGALNAYFQDLFTGVFLVLAMIVQTLLSRRRDH
ncbi:ABC transporter permease [Microbacterium sp. p3-SID338]|uniref:ABC transporter permease n=1 Tax=unclassified Microbacterium TaxID=2609290 RepID=UPI00078958CE|nr:MULTISPECIES: ABC transporter permease [unclassified Microbacterium]KYK00123.1 ATPase [Microbacterium sp. CH1]MCT1397155.1 ABC transporter permease [Microbacterium sp. p3-SID338]PMC05137.1 ABC transporter permease [Microbacterium sp. UMB0228]